MPPMPRTAALWALGSLAFAGVAAASDVPPWRDPHDLPLPPDARSATVNRPDLPIEADPSAGGGRRGAAILGAHLPVYGAYRGPGCLGRWLSVGPLAWVCEDGVALGPQAPIDPGDRSALVASHGLPFRYYFVGHDGSYGYKSLRDADEVAPEQELEPGFAVAVVDEGAKGDEHYALTHHGLWVPMRDLGAIGAFAFHGETVSDGKLDFGWIVEDHVPTFTKPEPSARAKPTRARFERVAVLEEKKTQGQPFLRTGDGEWVRARDVRRPTRAPAPPEVGPGERWIDVEIASQTLVAYEAGEPVFATLVSTGKGPPGSESATPKGTFRIWVKLRSTNMDNLEDEEAERYYAIEDVPYVQFFSKGVGLHGAFWHRSFGHVRSHGCVNLAPLDAQRLFAFTAPRLPAGWSAALPTPVEQGTVVRVR
jgi:hypothetical protein